MNDTLKKIQNLLLRKFSYISRIPTVDKVVFLTFDDGPEPGITEFVLDELDKYGFKATFFCRGDNAENNPELFDQVRERGHSIASHTYSHLHAYEVPTKVYLLDVSKANAILHTHLFRPPHGSMTFRTWARLHRDYQIVFWSLNSNDFTGRQFNLKQSIDNLTANTKAGDIVLFHFCKKHENETKQILPLYLEWLKGQGYIGKSL